MKLADTFRAAWWSAGITLKMFWWKLSLWPVGTRVRLLAPSEPVDGGLWVVEERLTVLGAYLIKRPDGPLGERRLVNPNALERI